MKGSLITTVGAQNKSVELKKHVGTIHSSNRLTLVQRKIANALLFNAYEHLLDQDEHQIHITTLCRLIGYDSKDYKNIRNALVALISTVIEWNLVDKHAAGEEIWNASSIIADVSIKGPMCTYSYSNKMRKLLYQPEIYGRLNMRVQSRFKSTYGLALYENCIRYQDIKQTPWFDLPTFRKLMGIEEGKYVIFRDFKKRVLDKAIMEVNQNAPIFLEVRFKKEGKQVVAIQFLIKKAEQLDSEPAEDTEIELQAQNLLVKLKENYGFSRTRSEQILQEYAPDYIKQKMNLIENSATFKSGKIVNLAKYLEKALQEDYQAPKSSRDSVDKLQQIKLQSEEVKKFKEKQLSEYRKYQEQEILKVYESLGSKQKLIIEKEFGAHIQHNVYYTLFKKSGFANILVVEKFCDFVRYHKKELLVSLLSFEDFCSSIEKVEENF